MFKKKKKFMASKRIISAKFVLGLGLLGKWFATWAFHPPLSVKFGEGWQVLTQALI